MTEKDSGFLDRPEPAETLPKEQSLTTLFASLGIDHILLKGEQIGVEKLDELILTTTSDSPAGVSLFRISKPPEEGGIGIGARSGATERPWVRTDGGLYSFTRARFYEGNFIVTARIIPKIGETVERDYTVIQLREALSDIAQPPRRRPLHHRIIGFLRRKP